ncbi:MAG: glycosyltransferase, partial [Phascolarctobacterium sp.]|nr:glycosyltransferase [Candidatus Phascolarctobacterium equi]
MKKIYCREGLRIMNNGYGVSVVVCTYNSDWEKLKKTVLRFLSQKGVLFEIIVSDDGSKEDYFDDLRRLFQEYDFKDYTLIKHEMNVGTVKNMYGAILRASGEYIFGSAPGDFAYDCWVLKSLYDFCKDGNKKMCFGNVVYYQDSKGTLVHGIKNNPMHMSLFSDNSHEAQCENFFFGDFVCGVSFFRERDTAIKYFDK